MLCKALCSKIIAVDGGRWEKTTHPVRQMIEKLRYNINGVWGRVEILTEKKDGCTETISASENSRSSFTEERMPSGTSGKLSVQ